MKIIISALRLAGVFGLGFDCSSACAAPAAPDYSGVAAANEKSAEYAYNAAKERLDFDKAQYKDSAPYIQRMRDLGVRFADQQTKVADANQNRADQQWDQQQQTFRPIEQQMALESMGIHDLGAEDAAKLTSLMGEEGAAMDPQERAQQINALVSKSEDAAAGRAVTQTNAQANSAVAQQSRNLTRMGGDPNKIAAAAAELATNQTATTVGAANAARDKIHQQGVTLRAGSANFGRNMPNTAAQAYGLTLNAGNSATGQMQSATNAALPNAQLVDGAYGQGQQAASMASQAAIGYGNMLTNSYGQQVNAFNAQMNAQNQSDAGFGQLLGTIGGIAGKALFASSKELKHGGRTIDGEAVLEKIDRVPVEKWRYNPGVSDEGEHVGPYAEDVQREFGDEAAPGGKAIDIVTMSGLNLAALKALNHKVNRLEARLGVRG